MEKSKKPELVGEKILIEYIHKILEHKRRKTFPNLPLASEEEYLRANKSNGLEIIKNPRTGLHYVIHLKEGEGIIVPTPAEIFEKYGITSLQGYDRYFATALLLQFHGKPCEEQSRKIGGAGYDRI